MSDLDKLMGKLKNKQSPGKEEEIEEDDDADFEDEDDSDDSDDEEEFEESNDKKKTVKSKEDVKDDSHKENDDDLVRNEVEILNNNGIFRRELLITLKDLVDVYKVNTQTLIDIKKKFDAEDGTNEKK